MKVLEILIKILSIVGLVWTVLQVHRVVIAVGGFFKTKKFAQTDKRFTYGICIAARNEQNVITNLLDSIHNQDYPLEFLKVFVIAHNCTDKTAEIVREYAKTHKELEIIVYEHNNPNERTKGFALKQLFNEIKEERTIECCDGYLIFDADNVLNQDYMSRMNEAFASGKKVITSFRNSKNFFQNWVSFQYGIVWMITCLMENRGKSWMNRFSCRIQGTGFLFANEIVKDGWNYTSLTEDRALCTDLVIKNYEISYCDQAIFFDEQPHKLKVAWRQRLRWSKGHLQAAFENEPKLIKNMIKCNKNFLRNYDCFFLNFPRVVESICRKIIIWGIQIAIGIMIGKALGAVWGVVLSILIGWLMLFAICILGGAFTLIYYRKRIKDFHLGHCILGLMMYGSFYLIGRFTTYIALFKKIDWKPIPHDRVMDIKKLN